MKKTAESAGIVVRRSRRLRASSTRSVAAVVVALAAFLAPWAPPSVWADPVTAGNVTAELISERETIRPGQEFTVAVALRPSAGWHTYWRNPGDSGLPTRVDWKLPDGFRAGPLEWPHPESVGQPPFVTYGYDGDVLLLTRIDAPPSLRAGSDAEIVAKTRWLACREDACIPGKADLRLRIRVENSEGHRDPRWSSDFDAARARLPRSIDGWTARLRDSGDSVRIEVAAPPASRPSTTGIRVFPTTAGILDASAAVKVTASEAGFVIDAAREADAAPLPDPLGLVLVTDGGWDADGEIHALKLDARVTTEAIAVEVAADTRPGPAAADRSGSATTMVASRVGADPAGIATAGSPGGLTLWAAVALAFLGGLALNLMPCVFPVLSLKVLGFLHVAHHDDGIARRHGLVFAAGVLLSFWVLAGILIALRAAGGAFGWGFQLQEPLFVAAIAGLLLAMSLNLLGVFEVGASLAGAAGRFDSEGGYRGSFLSGILATVLATPCSAPFMGTAIGFALVQPAAVAMAVFTFLGAGMAAPYVVLSSAPSLLRRLPRPGPWMETFRHVMAFPLLATVVWLVWVFGKQTGNDGVLLLLLALLLGSMGAWAAGRFRDGRGLAAARVFCACSLAGAAALGLYASGLAASAPATLAAAGDATSVHWLPWDPEAIPRHRDAGRVVFVDFTADWCLSCKVNERVALAGEEFAQSIHEHAAVAMKADWTRADPRITEALADFGRSGVPLYVVYPRDPAREPIVLPQILTPGIVRDALVRAAA